MSRKPLAEKMRPQTIEDVIGQRHLLADGKILDLIIKSKEPVNLILWGPPGSGKTTLARIISDKTKADFIELSAVTSGKKDVTQVIEHAKQNWNLKIRTILFVDEIHRFNKAQQDAFLPHVESGLITLIGATTENPSFEVISPLLSRSRVLVLEPLSKDEILTILKRTVDSHKPKVSITKSALDYIAEMSSGDARLALGNLELAIATKQKIDLKSIKETLQKNMPRYDKHGEHHHNSISAFIKSMRAGQIDATLYYLARIISAGEDPKFIARRMVIFASEDIGLAGNGALDLALNAFMAVERIGMPESNNILFHVATALAKSQKSRQTNDAMLRAFELAKKYPNLEIPLHIRNASTSLMKDLGYGKDYKMEAGFKHSDNYLPEMIKDKKIFY